MRLRRRSLRADLPFLCPVPGMTSFFDGRPRSPGGGSSAWEVLGGLPGSPGTRLGRWTIHRYGDRTAGGGRRRHHHPWRARGGLPVVFPAGVPVHRQARRLGACRGLAAETFAAAYRCRACFDPARGSLRSWLYGIAANLVRGLTVCISRAALPTRRQRRALPWEGPLGARPVIRRAGHADQDRSMSRWAGTALSRPLRRVGTTRGHRAKDGCGPSDAIGYRRPDLYGRPSGSARCPEGSGPSQGYGHRAGLRDCTPRSGRASCHRIAPAIITLGAAVGLAGVRDQQKPMEKLFGAAAALAEVLT